MRKIERITAKIQANKKLMERINNEKYYDIEDFIRDGESWINAIKERRMCCIVKSVSSSGMSRQFAYNAFDKGNYRQYLMFLQTLGERVNWKNYTISVSGCGMDMNNYTNYCIIRTLNDLGFITKAQSTKLEQMTPTVL